MVATPAVRLTISPCDDQVAAGDTLHVTIGLDDAGDGGAYHLAVHGLPETWYTLDRAAVALDPGARTEVDLAIRPPASRGRRADAHDVVVEARAEGTPAVLASATLRLSVRPLDGVGVDVWPARATGAVAVFGATAFNGLAWDASVELVVEAPPGLDVRVAPAGYAVVPAGGALPFTVRVAPTGVRAAIGPYDLTVYGVRPGGERAEAATRARVVRFAYRPPLLSGLFVRPFPTRFVLVAGPVLLLLVLGIVAASGATRAGPAAPSSFSSAGVAGSAQGAANGVVSDDADSVSVTPGGGIARFSAAPDPSGGVVVTWSAPRALTVLLDGQRVPRSGQQTLRLTRPATIVLTAIVADGVVTRRLSVTPAPATVETRRAQRPRGQRAVPPARGPSPSPVPLPSPSSSPASGATTEPRATGVVVAGSAAHRAASSTDTPSPATPTRRPGASSRRSDGPRRHAQRLHAHATPAARVTPTPRPVAVRKRRVPADASARQVQPQRHAVHQAAATRTPIRGTALPVKLARPTATLAAPTRTRSAVPTATATPSARVQPTSTSRTARATATATVGPRRDTYATATPGATATATRIAARSQAHATATPPTPARSRRMARATPTRTRSTPPVATATAITSGNPAPISFATRTPTAQPSPTRTARSRPQPTPTAAAAPSPRATPTATRTPEPETQPSPTSAATPAAPAPTNTPSSVGGGPAATPSAEPAPTATALVVVRAPTATPTDTRTPTVTPTPTMTPTPTPSPSATATPTPTPTDPPPPTATVTPTDTPTVTPTPTPRHHRKHGKDGPGTGDDGDAA